MSGRPRIGAASAEEKASWQEFIEAREACLRRCGSTGEQGRVGKRYALSAPPLASTCTRERRLIGLGHCDPSSRFPVSNP